MKIAILSRNAQLYSTRRLMEAAKQRGHSVRVLDTLRCYISINARQPVIHYKGKKIARLDAVIPRIGTSISFYGVAVVRQFEMIGVFSANKATAISRAGDKLAALQHLACQGIGLPLTGFAHALEDTDDLITLLGAGPLVLKLLEGSQGVGVMLAESRQAAASIVGAFMGLKANIMVQEFVKEADGADIRCLVIGGEVVAAMMRQGKAGEFRANLHRGGKASSIEITPEEHAMAILATQVMDLNIAGVDILRSRHGPVVIEVNSSPGLQGIEETSGKDLATLIIKFLEKSVTPVAAEKKLAFAGSA